MPLLRSSYVLVAPRAQPPGSLRPRKGRQVAPRRTHAGCARGHVVAAPTTGARPGACFSRFFAARSSAPRRREARVSRSVRRPFSARHTSRWVVPPRVWQGSARTSSTSESRSWCSEAFALSLALDLCPAVSNFGATCRKSSRHSRVGPVRPALERRWSVCCICICDCKPPAARTTEGRSSLWPRVH